VELTFTEDALEAIADKAIARKTGARGLRAIMEAVMLDVMYDIPTLGTVETCVINREIVEGQGKPVLVYRGEEAPARSGTGS
jgi:ATP-dependent Clp protease ATP-binding subunit ClpX